FSGATGAPLIIRRGITRLSRGNIAPWLAARVIRASVRSLARQFIAGSEPADALKSLELLRKEGAALSVDLLGEAVLSDAEARHYRERYLALLGFLVPKFITRQGPHGGSAGGKPADRLDISLKISSFYSQIEPLNWEGSIESIKAGLRPVFEKAGALGASVTFDMEHYYFKDLTIAVFKRMLEESGDIPFAGIALQAYLKDTRRDLEGLIEWARVKERRISVRLVKGAYWDYETVINRQKGWPVPVFLHKDETDRVYEELTRLLFENADVVYPAIASHNIRSIGNAIALAEELGLSGSDFEFQVLYGMGEPIRRALRHMPVRVYSPVGELIPGMAYLVRRILENTSNESFLRKSFAEGIAFEGLVQAPAVVNNTGKEPATNDEEGFRNEPFSDFSRAETRSGMADALHEARKGLGRRYPLYIGGEELFTSAETLSMNPARPAEIIGRVSSASKADAERAVEEAKKAYASWRKAPAGARADSLARAAAEMRKRRFALAALEVYEVGKPIMEADGDVAEAIDYLEYYGRLMRALARPGKLGRYPGEVNEYLYEPKGVGVVISPWNFPLAILTGMASAGVVAGNCVILKPSGLSPVIAWQLIEVFRAAGLPPGVVQFVPGPGAEVGEYLVTHPGVDFIAFTGSKDVGLRIIRLAGETHPGQANVKRVIAEMGGKNAVIVDATADLDEAVKGVVESALGYQGQKCSACSRVIALPEVFDEFCGRLKEAVKSVEIGPPEAPSSFMGPLVSKEAREKVNRYIEQGRKEGRAILMREERGEGYYVGPAVFEVSPDALIAREEIFGPVVAVVRAHDIDEALAIANSTGYALTGGIFSRSPANILKAKEEFRAGNLYINRKITGALVGRQPFGGIGMSGVGSKAGGPDYLLQFMDPKTISENTIRKGIAPEVRG
ncbi:MAG TPA: L-glutamate gamma-semialdehyde dehydrogenase, partial [Dissulfurispiraceae bacterium]